MAGGTFLDDQPGDPSVAGAATGYFLIVSALLAEATSDPIYLQAANESANFIRSHLYSFRSIVQEIITVDVNNAFACQVVNLLPSSSGLMIEGLSILASITNSTSTEKLLSDLLVAVIPNPDWQGANGIVSETGDLAGDMNLLQGLGIFYVRNSTASTLRQYVGDYIAVQFNAVTNLATSNNTNIYGSTSTGPPDANFGGDNQTTALGALLGAIALETPSSVSPSPSSSSPSPTNSPSPIATTSRPKSSHLGAILGGALGGAAVFILMILWYLRREHSTRNAGPSSKSRRTPPFLASSINPFTTQTSIIASLSPGHKSGETGRPPRPINMHTVNGRAETHQMDPSVITHGDENMSVENSQVGRNDPAPIHPSATQETHHIEPATVIADEDRVNVNFAEDSAASVLPTEVLPRILSQRMQRLQWDEGGDPPEYATAA
ncbi:hypothetical protein B0H19DRAFT_1265091 [Mycena capillaripes]|nr:hypothetical protein B0H19DRAFT_1265091 [Mycena capillaripes]